MAEGSSTTNKAYAAAALWFQAGTGGDRPVGICLDSGSMAAFDETTNAPTDETGESGLTRAEATLTIEDSSGDLNDICQCYHKWTAGEDASITGSEGMSTSTTGGNMLWWHRWAATLSGLASGDTIEETVQLQFKLGS